MAADTRKCSAKERAGRLAKARQFIDAAALIDDFTSDGQDLADAYVTLCVHAGIAAADAICCARLGMHATGQDHSAATALLGQVDKSLANDLQRLLGLKDEGRLQLRPVERSGPTNGRKNRRSARRGGDERLRFSAASAARSRCRCRIPLDPLSAHRPTLWCKRKGEKDGPRSDRAAATASGMVAASRPQRSARAELPDVDLHRPQRQQHRGH